MTPPTPPAANISSFPAGQAWWLVVLGALGFLVWTNRLRIERVHYITQSAGWSVATPAEDPRSPTGYVDGQRRLIVPGHHNASYRWIMQAQQMLVRGDWRQRRTDSDNAPLGRDSLATLPYRGWLAFLAWLDHLVSGRSLPLAVEHAALFADPVLHGLLVVGVSLFCVRHFGRLAAAIAAVALVTLMPLAGSFQPGAPDEHALAWVCAVWSLLPLLAALRDPARPEAGTGLFVGAGVAGGIGLWNDWVSGWPVVAGVGAGALLSIFTARRGNADQSASRAPWRLWALAGAMTCVAGYLCEYFPSPLDWKVASVHPLAAVAWLGLGELLVRLTAWWQEGRSV